MPTYADVIIDIVVDELKSQIREHSRLNPYDVVNGLRGKCRDRIAAEIDTWFKTSRGSYREVPGAVSQVDEENA